MRLAFFHELPEGGAKRAVNEFGKYLAKNHVVDLYYIAEKKENIKSFNDNNYFKFTPQKWSGKNWKARIYKDSLELIKLQNLHKKIAKIIDDKRYDFVVVNASKFTQSPFLLKYLKTYSVYYCHDPHLRIAYEKILGLKNNLPLSRRVYENINRGIRKRIDRSNILSANVLIANSLFTRKGVKRAYGLDSPVSYLGVEETTFRPQKIKKDIDILFVGSTEELDGYYDLQHILNYLPRLNIKILDFKKEWIADDHEMAKIYNRSKIILCLAYNEPFGLVPLEAMSCATPVIAVNEGGYLETILHNKTGYLLKRNPKIIADKIDYLLKNSEIANLMGKEGRKYIEQKWTWKISADNLITTIKESMQSN